MSKLKQLFCRHNPKHRKLLLTLEGQYKVYECTRCGKRFNQPIKSWDDMVDALSDMFKTKTEPLYTQYEEVK